MANSNSIESGLDERIIRQVEYYFGDFNLPRDKFLQEQIKLDDGWVPLSTMLNFKRLAALTTDQDRIIDAIKKSPFKLMEIDEEQKKIRRSSEKPVPLMSENRQKEIQSRTVYCKGFTNENSSLDKLLEYFSQYGSIENVQRRTYLDKATKEYIFKGSVFVVFTAKDEVDEFLKKEKVEYEGVPLIVKRQEDYFIDKKKERDDKKKMQRAKLQQVTNKQPAIKKEKDEENKDSDEEEEKPGTGFAKGAVLHIKGVPSDATWEDIKSAVEAVWKAGAKEGEGGRVDVAYVDFHMGDEEGWIRLAEAGSAAMLLSKAKRAASLRDDMEVDEGKDKEEGRKTSDAAGGSDGKNVNGGAAVTVNKEEQTKDLVEVKPKEEKESGKEGKVKEEKSVGEGKTKEEEKSGKQGKAIEKEKSGEEGKAIEKEGKAIEKKSGEEGKAIEKEKSGEEGKAIEKESGEEGKAIEKESGEEGKAKEEERGKDDGEEGKGNKTEKGNDSTSKRVKDEPMSDEEKAEEEGGDGETVKMEVCGVLVEMRVLRGSEEEAYLEKAQGARERRFMSGGKGRGRGGGRRGGGRRGRSNRGGKRKYNWDSGPSNKRQR